MRKTAPQKALRRKLLLGGMAFCAAGGAAGGALAHETPTNHVIEMDNMRYGEAPPNLKVGDIITWVNRDTVPHTVTARNRSFDLRMGPGQSKRMRLLKAGTLMIYCTYHPAMRGKLTVAPK